MNLKNSWMENHLKMMLSVHTQMHFFFFSDLLPLNSEFCNFVVTESWCLLSTLSSNWRALSLWRWGDEKVLTAAHSEHRQDRHSWNMTHRSAQMKHHRWSSPCIKTLDRKFSSFQSFGFSQVSRWACLKGHYAVLENKFTVLMKW